METVSCTREIAVEKDYDVVVLGGGPSGLMAAAAAAKAGASTAIIRTIRIFRWNGYCRVGCSDQRLSLQR